MYVQMNCVIVEPDNANREELAAFLANFGALPIAQLPNVDQLQASSIGLTPRRWRSSTSIRIPPKRSRRSRELPRQYPNISFFLMSQTVDPNLLMEAMHLGVREFSRCPSQSRNSPPPWNAWRKTTAWASGRGSST